LFPLKDNIPTDRFPIVTVALIAANVFAYVFLQGGGWSIDDPYAGDWSLAGEAAFPCDLSGQCPPGALPQDHVGPILSVFTAMFMHGSLLHLGGNMLFLWIFGNNVEDAMGRLTFLGFYLLGGVAAMAAQTAMDPTAAVPTVGASGAVSAVLGGYLLLYPRARVITVVFIVFFFTIIEVPALVVLVLWFAEQVLFGALDYTSGGQAGGGVAFFAHIGGFLFGMLTIRLVARRKRAIPSPYRL
jgi:membrane associated rhomboid family serine protease